MIIIPAAYINEEIGPYTKKLIKLAKEAMRRQNSNPRIFWATKSIKMSEPKFKIGDKVEFHDCPNDYSILNGREGTVIISHGYSIAWKGYSYDIELPIAITIGSIPNVHTIAQVMENLLKLVEEKPTPLICLCERFVLMQAGCQCGVFQQEQALKSKS